jgi:hypothetical protein
VLNIDNLIFCFVKVFLGIGALGVSTLALLIITKNPSTIFKTITKISILSLSLGITGCIILLTGVFNGISSTTSIPKTGISKNIPPGTAVASKDKQLEQKDQSITVNSNIKELTLNIWDFAAVDGDYVQVFHNDKELSQPFMLTSDYKIFRVPAEGKIEIKGIKDGGGGITYALYVDETKETYFNDAPRGGFNTYTVTKKK